MIFTSSFVAIDLLEALLDCKVPPEEEEVTETPASFDLSSSTSSCFKTNHYKITGLATSLKALNTHSSTDSNELHTKL